MMRRCPQKPIYRYSAYTMSSATRPSQASEPWQTPFGLPRQSFHYPTIAAAFAALRAVRQIHQGGFTTYITYAAAMKKQPASLTQSRQGRGEQRNKFDELTVQRHEYNY